MWFQRITAGLLLLAIAALVAVSYFTFRANAQLQTLKSFVEGYVFADAVAACEKGVERHAGQSGTAAPTPA